MHVAVDVDERCVRPLRRRWTDLMNRGPFLCHHNWIGSYKTLFRSTKKCVFFIGLFHWQC